MKGKQTMNLTNIKYKKQDLVEEGFEASALILMLTVFVGLFILLSCYI